MITLRLRGRSPTSCATCSADLILCWYRSPKVSTTSALPAQILEPGLGGTRDRLRIPQRRVAPMLDVRHHAAHALRERHHGLPAEIALNSADVRPGAIGLAGALRNIHHVAPQKLDQAVDALRIAGAE